MKIITLFLTCPNRGEAQTIADCLLTKKLIACAKFIDNSAKFHWQGKPDTAEEVMLIMDSIEEHFKAIETEVAKLHSYDTFALTAIPVVKTTRQVEQWLKDSLK